MLNSVENIFPQISQTHGLMTRWRSGAKWLFTKNVLLFVCFDHTPSPPSPLLFLLLLFLLFLLLPPPPQNVWVLKLSSTQFSLKHALCFIPYRVFNDSLRGTCHGLFMWSRGKYADINRMNSWHRNGLNEINRPTLYFSRSICFKFSTVLCTASLTISS